ncbi:hypothetical protein TNCV_133621 [Trichonephila clavipes]|nr:hypothetical protein TNCV_133621 [Trichonephila clavipes]
MVNNSWLMCRKFDSSTSEDPPCREAMRVKSVEAQTSSRWCGEDVTEVPAEVSFLSLVHDSKLRGPLPIVLVLLQCGI